MEPVTEIVRNIEITSGKDRYVLTLDSEDFSVLYPGMVRYTLTIKDGEKTISVFRTNTYEYSPLVPFTAEDVAKRTADEWEHEIRNNPGDFILNHRPELLERATPSDIDLVVIQGSPRASGNCSILAGWAVEAAHDLGRRVRVIYPHDLDIRCCIGCYQCYNTGSCVFDDDMGSIIDDIRSASLLVVCSPVYTNTVPAGLKLVIDRCQAYHAERVPVWREDRPTRVDFFCSRKKRGGEFYLRYPGYFILFAKSRNYSCRGNPGRPCGCSQGHPYNTRVGTGRTGKSESGPGFKKINGE